MALVLSVAMGLAVGPVHAQADVWTRVSDDLVALAERCAGAGVDTLPGTDVLPPGASQVPRPVANALWVQLGDLDSDGRSDALLRPRVLRCRGSVSLLTGLGLCGANSCRHRLYLTSRPAESLEYFAADAVLAPAPDDGALSLILWREVELCREAGAEPNCALIGRFEGEEIRFEPAPEPIPLPSLSPAALDQA